MEIKDTSYEPIAELYNSFSDKGPLRVPEMQTILTLAGDIQGKSVLDLACGTGFFGLQFKKLGASRIVGVDISETMIKIAQEESQKQGADIEFHVRNISEMESFGKFDIIVAGWLFCNAASIEELDAMFQVAADNLKPSGKLVAYTIEPDYRLDKRDNYRHYELDFISESPWKGGFRYEAQFLTDPPSPLILYSWDRKYYESAMSKAGFKHFEWHKPMLTESDIERHPPGFWDVHQKNCWETGLICQF
ncbi:Methyltransferase [Xenorhabdus nematophila str. Anatoliense]|nr:Methyltransferase [Xenorhabdus nematophila str. Anatoliense]CEE95567.1 Methyltransferase [Xenorhabdus nematophila str. Anatoliense]